MKRVLIIGATSAMAQEAARCMAREGAEFFLAGRDETKLAGLAADLKVQGGNGVHPFQFEANDFPRHQEMLEAALKALGRLDSVLIAHGSLPDQQACEQSVDLTLKEFSTNCLSVIALLTRLAQYFEQERRGCIAVITSVAGDRGRKTNYIYGAAKGAVSLFLQGLRFRLYPAGVKVITIKPGFVDSPMTAHLPKNFLYASPQQAGQGICQAIQQGRDIAYVPWFWRFIMLIIKSIPEAVSKRICL